jgi:O-antigen ligase
MTGSGPAESRGSGSTYSLLSRLLGLEPWVLLWIGVIYWFPSPIRDLWIGVLALWLPFPLIRWRVHRRLWTGTRYDIGVIVLIGLSLLSTLTAPYATRGLILIYRPLFGAVIVLCCVERARIAGTMRGLERGLLLFALAVGVAALTATDWSAKGESGAALAASLPDWRGFDLWTGGFNPNEIAGAITWLLPFAAGVGLARRHPVGIAAALLLAVALGLGGSLAGLAGAAIGVLIALAPRRLWTAAAASALIALIAAQVVISAAPGTVSALTRALNIRDDTRSVDHRVELWASAEAILRAHPLTGAGIANYRSPLVRERYPTPGFDPRGAVHAHNEVLQIGADLGLPGIVAFAVIHAAALVMLWRLRGTDRLAAALAGALIGHAVYGLADAIPLWDRFSFVWWWVLGLIAARYGLWRRATSPR